MICRVLVLMVSISIATLVGGCCTPETVLVPVYSCPAPPPMTFPVLAVTRLSDNATTAESLQALAVDHVELRSNLSQCLILLDGYRTEFKAVPFIKMD